MKLAFGTFPVKRCCICRIPSMTSPNALHRCHKILPSSCFMKIFYKIPLMVVFILIHLFSSSNQISEIWTRGELGDDFISSLPTHFQIWFTETQKSLVIGRVFIRVMKGPRLIETLVACLTVHRCCSHYATWSMILHGALTTSLEFHTLNNHLSALHLAI